MNWKLINNKYVITKDGVNFAVTDVQLEELKGVIADIDATRISTVPITSSTTLK